jgi:type IV pilus assembly protein PilA
MTHYDVLAVPRDASLETIRASFTTQMNQWTSSTDPTAEERRRQIQTAYVVLSDPELRTTYDARLAQQAAEATAAPALAARISSADEIAAYENQPTPVLARNAFQDQRWAGFWRRFAAQLIDAMILYIPAVATIVTVIVVLSLLHINRLVAVAAAYLLWIVLFALYAGWLNSSDNLATLGRRAAGLAVVSASDGEPISFNRAFGRGALSFFSALLIFPNLLQPFTDRRQSLADMIAGTVVVKKRPGGSVVVVVLAVGLLGGVFVLGILAAIAIPAYQDYTVRARVTQALSTAQSFEQLVADNAYNRTQDLSTGFTPPAASINAARIEVSPTGIITVTMPDTSKNVRFTLSPSWTSNKLPAYTAPPADTAITWTCRVSAASSDRYVPSECSI